MESRALHTEGSVAELYSAQYCRDGCDVAEHGEPNRLQGRHEYENIGKNEPGAPTA